MRFVPEQWLLPNGLGLCLTRIKSDMRKSYQAGIGGSWNYRESGQIKLSGVRLTAYTYFCNETLAHVGGPDAG